MSGPGVWMWDEEGPALTPKQAEELRQWANRGPGKTWHFDSRGRRSLAPAVPAYEPTNTLVPPPPARGPKVRFSAATELDLPGDWRYRLPTRPGGSIDR